MEYAGAIDLKIANHFYLNHCQPAGNKELPKSRSFEIGNKDSTAPEIDCTLDGEQQQIISVI